jgi:hypothetical protein
VQWFYGYFFIISARSYSLSHHHFMKVAYGMQNGGTINETHSKAT